MITIEDNLKNGLINKSLIALDNDNNFEPLLKQILENRIVYFGGLKFCYNRRMDHFELIETLNMSKDQSMITLVKLSKGNNLNILSNFKKTQNSDSKSALINMLREAFKERILQINKQILMSDNLNKLTQLLFNNINQYDIDEVEYVKVSLMLASYDFEVTDNVFNNFFLKSDIEFNLKKLY